MCLLAFAGRAEAAYVLSNSECPSSGEIQKRLEGLVAVEGPDSARAMVDAGEKEIRIELATYGERPRLRVLPNEGTCAEKTDAVALVIAAWLDALPQNTLSAPATLPPLPLPPPPPIAPIPVATKLPRAGWIGMGAIGFVDGFSRGMAGRLGFALDHLKNNLGARLEIAMPWPRERELGDGRARFFEPSLSLLATWEKAWGAWIIEPALGGGATALVVDGTGYTKNRTNLAWRWSMEGGVRVTRTWGGRRAWVDTGIAYWPISQSARQIGPDKQTTATLALPSVRVFLGLGFSLRLF